MALGKKPQINTARIELLTADGEQTNVFFDIESANNPRARKADIGTNMEALFLSKIKDIHNATEEDNIEFAKAKLVASVQVMAACVTGWEWNGVALFEDDEPFDKPCTYDNVLELLNTPIDGIDILGQVTAKVAELGKPKPAPKKS